MIISNHHFSLNIHNNFHTASSSIHKLHNEQQQNIHKVHIFDNVEIDKPAKSALVFMGTEGSLSENLLIQTRLLDFSMSSKSTMEVSHKMFNDGETMELSKSEADDLLNDFYSVDHIVERYVKANLLSKEMVEKIADTPLDELDLNKLIDDDLDLENIKDGLLRDHEELKKFSPELSKSAEATFEKIIEIIDKKMIDKEVEKSVQNILKETGDDIDLIQESIDVIQDELHDNNELTKMQREVKEGTISKLKDTIDEILKMKKEQEEKAKLEEAKNKKEKSINETINQTSNVDKS